MNLKRSLAAAASLLAVVSPIAAGQSPADPALDSLLTTPVSSASKYAQSRADAPASITIVTAEQIREHGYTSLQELLEGVTGFYVTNDRNYSYLGVRGFSRPGDFNNRILLLLDGHVLNEQLWGSTPVGTDLPIALEAIERVEVVRGPSSVLYGSSAMLGVINLVTRTGVQLDGVRGGALGGNGNAREATVVAGYPLGSGRGIAMSALVGRRDGNDLYFDEFDTTASAGLARGLDWERRHGVVAAVELNAFTLRAGIRAREKGIPTASYGTRFGDPRARTRDAAGWVDAMWTWSPRPSQTVRMRGYFDRYQYEGTYPENAGPAYHDWSQSRAHGVEAVSIWEPASWYRVSLGTEIRGVVAADYREYFADGSVAADAAPYRLVAGWAQVETDVTRRLTLIGGLSHDHQSPTRQATTPRLAVVARPDARTSLKLLYGQAFRAPAPTEADMSTSYFTPNPSLRPERITTLEVAGERRLGRALLVSLSAFRYELDGLIEQTATEPAQYANLEAARTNGLETELTLEPSPWLSARAAYAWQKALRSDHSTMSNSPEHLVAGNVTVRGGGIRTSMLVRRESGRRTLTDGWTPSFLRTDLNVLYSPERRPAWWRGDVSLRVTNLLDARYWVPGGFEHRQAMIEQDGRTAALRLSWRL